MNAPQDVARLCSRRPGEPALVGVGMGPGDPELVTVKGVRVLESADLVVVPVMDRLEQGRAEATVRAHVSHDRLLRLVFALDDRGGPTAQRYAAWEAAADTVADQLREHGGTVAFATIGDPNVYSTFTYLARTIHQDLPELEVETVPGITAMQDLASKSGVVLLEGDERLALMPFTAGATALSEALEGFETVVCYKGGGRLSEVLRTAEEAGRLDDAVYGARLGIEGEEILRASEMAGREGTYLSTVIFGGRRERG